MRRRRPQSLRFYHETAILKGDADAFLEKDVRYFRTYAHSRLTERQTIGSVRTAKFVASIRVKMRRGPFAPLSAPLETGTMREKRRKRRRRVPSAPCLYRPEKQPTGGKSEDVSLLGFCANMIKEKENWEWITRPYDSELVSRLAQQTGVEPIVVQTLVGRKVVAPSDIVNFLAPVSLSRGLCPPYRLPGCQRASVYLAD
ncbi:MAG: hypothetical protein J6X44_05620, partial [Thermoguttaceae bacterium]|nr:hypothetical protein [Thermoguttaceae bacterium]